MVRQAGSIEMVDATIREEVLRVLEQLSIEQQQALLYFGRAMGFMQNDSNTGQQGVPARSLLDLAGLIPPEDLAEIEQAIKAFDKVDLNEW
ncbi:MAG: hypothetical protein SF123_22225 [Chloroflexota bacterium]|nr:hypothetical protein [Chloroflexota bacterium]